MVNVYPIIAYWSAKDWHNKKKNALFLWTNYQKKNKYLKWSTNKIQKFLVSTHRTWFKRLGLNQGQIFDQNKYRQKTDNLKDIQGKIKSKKIISSYWTEERRIVKCENAMAIKKASNTKRVVSHGPQIT